MKTVIRITCEETKLERPDRRLFCLLLLGPEAATLPFVEIWLPPCSRRVQRDPLGPCSQKSPAHKWLVTRISN